MDLPLEAIGGAVVSLLIGIGGGITWWEKRAARKARAEAEAAVAGADRSVADAEHTLYTLLAKRLNSVEEELQAVRKEFDLERRRGRELETHIFHLENLMRAAGLNPPERVRLIG